MNPQWITAGIAAVGLAGQVLWTTINLRIENRILKRLDDLKEWCDSRYVRVPQAAPGERSGSWSSAVSAQSSASVSPIQANS